MSDDIKEEHEYRLSADEKSEIETNTTERNQDMIGMITLGLSIHVDVSL